MNLVLSLGPSNDGPAGRPPTTCLNGGDLKLQRRREIVFKVLSLQLDPQASTLNLQTCYDPMRKTVKGKQLKFRCWIDIDGERFFGPGRAELLQLIHETGSISKAAKAMGMSYKKAWEMIEGLNTNSSKPYVVAHKGGEKGGGTEVTAAGLQMLVAYQKLNDKVFSIIDKNMDILKLI